MSMFRELTAREMFLPTCDRLPPGISELESSLLPYLALVDHGYDPSEIGRTAAATFILGHLYTAAHNLRDGRATVIVPSGGGMVSFNFLSYDPDTAVSLQALPDTSPVIKLGAPQPGDLLLVYWLRHIGGGVFSPCHMWGKNIGQVRQGNGVFWGFQREGVVPKPGDSGALVMTIGRKEEEISPEAIGVLRGTLANDSIGVFSPL